VIRSNNVSPLHPGPRSNFAMDLHSEPKASWKVFCQLFNFWFRQ